MMAPDKPTELADTPRGDRLAATSSSTLQFDETTSSRRQSLIFHLGEESVYALRELRQLCLRQQVESIQNAKNTAKVMFSFGFHTASCNYLERLKLETEFKL